MSDPTTHVGVLPDGTNVMVTSYANGRMSVATREDSWEPWSPPVWLTKREWSSPPVKVSASSLPPSAAEFADAVAGLTAKGVIA